MSLPVANILQPLINVAEAVMVFFHDNLGFGWGLSIVALTFVTRLVILPLTLKQLRSMRTLQVLQPQIKEIQKKYKEDRQRQQQEMMRFYQQHKVNPFASCLPLLMQLPVFITLFYMLRHDLKPHLQLTASHGGNDGWLFIPHLDAKSTGAVLVVLVILYVGTQLAAGAVTAVSADKTQRTMMYVLPLIFVPFIITFPSGLVVYWIATNTWTLGQQLAVRRFMPPPVAATPEAIQAAKAPPQPPRKKKRRR